MAPDLCEVCSLCLSTFLRMEAPEPYALGSTVQQKLSAEPKQASSYVFEELRLRSRWFLLAGFLFREYVLYHQATDKLNQKSDNHLRKDLRYIGVILIDGVRTTDEADFDMNIVVGRM